MLISLNWLKNYIDLDGISPEEIEHKLSTSGLEVEGFTDQNKTYENIVVGYVKERKKHPNADKLSVCIVNDGKEDLSVVCSAPNVDAGQKIVFAKIDAVVPSNGMKLSKVKLRGEVSNGMICSERELIIGDDHSGIMVLDEKLKEGTPISKALGLDDVVFEISITPNRQDALSHYGIARDLAALYNKELKLPEIKIEEDKKHASEYASVEIENVVDCPRYSAKVVTGVEIKESPEWLKKYLKAIGSRPINNVVDVTNFILHELGQPLHAFDLDNVAGHKIIIKNAVENSEFVTLDSKKRKMKSTDLMICDGEKPVAVAGVMGGENSEVTNKTKNILIESAYFRPGAVRKTAKHLGLSTDASYRFERGCNPDITLYAANRAAQLIAELGGGKVAEGEIDVYPNPIKSKEVKLRFDRITKVLGIEVPKENVVNILNKLELKVKEQNENYVVADVPPFRHDIEREIDLIEEVARIYGYDKIPNIEKIVLPLDVKVDQSDFTNKVRNIFKSLGFNEIITNSLLNHETAKKYGSPVSVMNPQNSEMSDPRPSLLHGMLATVSRNIKVKEKNLQLFEIGHVFKKINESSITSFNDFTEEEHIIIAVTGNSIETEWGIKEKKYDFYDLKGFANEFLKNIYLDNLISYSYNNSQNAHLEYSYDVIYKNSVLAAGGKVVKSSLKEYDIEQEVYVFDFNISKLKEIKPEVKRFSELLKYPKIIRDFAFVVDKNIDSLTIADTIKNVGSKLLKDIKLFDIFESDSLGEGKKSLAYQLDFYDESRTLTEEEVDKDFWKIIEEIKTKHHAQLRG
ncbi:MAG: phenylalanine--tRNA ligase subunit beta [Ignavibacteria bacterium GWB2_35_6b]|nr:MAG: phenylalanine--tRNA ligase subunit beta [Ignavibacteria bacterium GWB2_35_6b]